MSYKLESTKKWLKWFLLLFVIFMVVLNYYGFTQVIDEVLQNLNNMLEGYGYYLDMVKPVSFFFKILPGIGVIGYVITLTNKNVINAMQNLYNVVTIAQLALLALLLPILLFYQNKIYGKISNYGTK